VQRSSNAEKEAAKIYSEALSEDSSVFDYDGAYDSFKTASAASHPLSRPTISEAPVSFKIIKDLLRDLLSAVRKLECELL
jgi:hypothetical protein